MKEFSTFMDKYYPEGDKEDSYATFGYAAARLASRPPLLHGPNAPSS
jgi:hypothetical protein